MISLITPKQAQLDVGGYCKQQRISCNYTQQELSLRSGVALSSLRKFERTGIISLEGFFKIAVILGILDKIVQAVKPDNGFANLDDIIKFNASKLKKRVRK